MRAGGGAPVALLAGSRSVALLVLLVVGTPATASALESERPRVRDAAYQVYPGEEIQQILELAAADSKIDRVQVHAGTYRPQRPGQAMIWFNARHDGITLEALGRVVLTAANPELADRDAPSYPAIVNHVVYFGDGISPSTVLRGFEITGANGFETRSDEGGKIERDFSEPELQPDWFFYSDGGGIKVFGRSYPTLDGLEIYDNYTSPCGGGISVEHRGFNGQAVTIRNTILRNNRTRSTGSAVDLLPGSSAIIENTLFTGNLSNAAEDIVSAKGEEYQKESGSGALTVFEGSRVWVRSSTFTGNWNGVDDKGRGNRYTNNIFWQNNLSGGVNPGPRYEMDILDGSGVRGNFVGGGIADVRGAVDPNGNRLDAADPKFDRSFVPQAPGYDGVGYRPVP